MYDSVKSTFINEYKNKSELYKARLIKWNSEPTIVRVAKPTNIARARELGYKAKEGVIIARVGVRAGGRKRRKPAGGRKPSKSGRFFSLNKSLQAIAEERAARKFSNCEVLNSYFVGQTGSRKFYEIILLDRNSSVIRSDQNYVRIISHPNRVFRGLTSIGRKHRGISMKGFGTNKNRPSKRANIRG